LAVACVGAHAGGSIAIHGNAAAGKADLAAVARLGAEGVAAAAVGIDDNTLPGYHTARFGLYAVAVLALGGDFDAAVKKQSAAVTVSLYAVPAPVRCSARVGADCDVFQSDLRAGNRTDAP